MDDFIDSGKLIQIVGGEGEDILFVRAVWAGGVFQVNSNSVIDLERVMDGFRLDLKRN